jgi:cobalt/nickel transport system permease protein
MITLLATIDHHASLGDGPWHRASALSKLIVVVVILGVAIASPSLLLLAVLHALAWILVLGSRLPWRVAILAAAYPLLFLGLFVIARWDGTAATPLFLVLRPLTASLTMAWLVSTTPYPDLFAPISRILPRQTGDSLFLTYRALFALFARSERLHRALRLRGGFSGSARRRLALAGEGMGTLAVHGFDRSRNLYAAMLLRGHSGRICGCRHFAHRSTADLLSLAALAGVVLAAVTLWRAP